jgi:O-methyltransferase involved in polyketide biosynthesis
MVAAEGLTPYLPADEGLRLVSRLVSHLAGGELMFDAYSHFGLTLLRLHPSLRATGAEVHWAIDDPHELELAVPKLRFVEDISAYQPEHAARMGWSAKLFVRLWKHIPALRKIGRLLRYRF